MPSLWMRIFSLLMIVALRIGKLPTLWSLPPNHRLELMPTSSFGAIIISYLLVFIFPEPRLQRLIQSKIAQNFYCEPKSKRVAGYGIIKVPDVEKKRWGRSQEQKNPTSSWDLFVVSPFRSHHSLRGWLGVWPTDHFYTTSTEAESQPCDSLTSMLSRL